MQEKRIQNFMHIRGNLYFSIGFKMTRMLIYFCHTHPISSPAFPTQKRKYFLIIYLNFIYLFIYLF
jgi:hypothetical protein